MKIRNWIIFLLLAASCRVKTPAPLIQGEIIKEAKQLNPNRIKITEACHVNTTYANIVYDANSVFPIFGGFGESVNDSAIREKLKETKFPDAACDFSWDVPAGQGKVFFHELMNFYAEKLHLKRSADGAIVPDFAIVDHGLWLLDYSFEQSGIDCYIQVKTGLIEDKLKPGLVDTRKLKFTNRALWIIVEINFNAKPKNPWQN